MDQLPTQRKGAGETQPSFSIKKSKQAWKLGLMIALVIGLGVWSLFTGAYDLSREGGWQMFFITRVPRTMALMLTGSAMSMAGLVMQLLTQNRFAEPTTTGSIEWAGLGLVFVYGLSPNPTLWQRTTGAIVFSFIGTLIFFLFLRRVKLKSSLIVPIIGMMLGAVISAITTFVSLVFNMTHSLEVWFAGSFAPVQRGRYEYLWLIILVVLLVYYFADRLTVVGLGEDIAKSLGLNYQQVLLVGTALISLTVGIVSAVIGNLSFLGLIVPNVVSLFRGDDLRTNLPWVCLLGMAVITLCDIISRTIIMPFEVPVSLILGTVGSFVFMAILWQQRRKQFGS